jgi:hypothetical protein
MSGLIRWRSSGESLGTSHYSEYTLATAFRQVTAQTEISTGQPSHASIMMWCFIQCLLVVPLHRLAPASYGSTPGTARMNMTCGSLDEIQGKCQ